MRVFKGLGYEDLEFGVYGFIISHLSSGRHCSAGFDVHRVGSVSKLLESSRSDHLKRLGSRHFLMHAVLPCCSSCPPKPTGTQEPELYILNPTYYRGRNN